MCEGDKVDPIFLKEIVRSEFDLSLPLLNPGALWFFVISNWFKKYFCYIKIMFAINQFQSMQNIHLWHKSRKKYLALFIPNHYHHVVPLSRISLTLSRHFSLSFIGFSGLHPAFSHSCCMYVRTGLPAFVWPYAGVHIPLYLFIEWLLYVV